VVIALADRLGRRKLILFSLAGACAANLVAGLAPSFEVFTGAQLFTRAFVNACLIVAGIAAVEEAPEGARAFATAMFALALGVGIALGVIFLPFADLGNYGWRISFIASAGALFFLPFVGRQLRRRGDTTRRRAVGRAGRVREVSAPRIASDSCCPAWWRSTSSSPSSKHETPSHLAHRLRTRRRRLPHRDRGLPGVIGVLAGRLTEPGVDQSPSSASGRYRAQMLFFVMATTRAAGSRRHAIVAGAQDRGTPDAELSRPRHAARRMASLLPQEGRSAVDWGPHPARDIMAAGPVTRCAASRP
jgi:hypothetical protein